jgi:uncharacterized protein (TIGR03790 family)
VRKPWIHRFRLQAASTLLLLMSTGFPVANAAPGPAEVLLVINRTSPASREIGSYYKAKRGIPDTNICSIATRVDETVDRSTYVKEIVKPIANCLRTRKLTEQVLYLVLTLGVPLRVGELGADTRTTESASIDSELTLLYQQLKGGPEPKLAGPLPNPFFQQRDVPFAHPNFPMYLVTRLAAYDVATVKKMIDRSLAAANRGNFIIDLRGADDRTGNDWLRTSAVLLPTDRLVLDESDTVLMKQKGVIAYASWGSNDGNRNARKLGFEWLPGAIVSEFVSTNGRTFVKPPDTWTLGKWADRKSWYFESPQSLAGDYLEEGATGATAHVNEPYLQFTARPDYLLPAYYQGRNLAESFWLSIPALSWQNIVLGDPLCTLGRPPRRKR